MHFDWNEQTIRWFTTASAYTGFHKKLAHRIVPHLEPGGTLCDIGCGLGRLSLKLAPYVSELTCVDINESVLAALKRDAGYTGANNIRILRQDAEELEGCFDVVLMSFFGRINMLNFLKYCRCRLIRVVSAENKSGLYPERHRRNDKDTVPTVCGELAAQGVHFKLERCTLDFGQPLQSRRDAEQFVLHNAPEASAEEISNFLREHLENTGMEDFPYFLPSEKELGIFIIDKENDK